MNDKWQVVRPESSGTQTDGQSNCISVPSVCTGFVEGTVELSIKHELLSLHAIVSQSYHPALRPHDDCGQTSRSGLFKTGVRLKGWYRTRTQRPTIITLNNLFPAVGYVEISHPQSAETPLPNSARDRQV